MQAKNQMSLFRKSFYALIVLVVSVSIIRTESFPSAEALEYLDAPATVDSELENLLEIKMQRNGFLDDPNLELMVFDTNVEYPYAVIGYHIADPKTLPEFFSPDVALARNDGEGWSVLIREIDKQNFNEVLDAIPLTMLSDDSKVVYAYHSVSEVDSQATYSGHYLPWPNGVTYPVTQRPGNCGSHCVGNFGEFAWDFGIPNGAEVWSSKTGTVSRVQEGNATGTFSWNTTWSMWCTPVNTPPNYVVINHDQGASLYLHLKQNSVPDGIFPGATPDKAALVGGAGNVGYICSSTNNSTSGTHLHFQVEQQSSSTYWTQSGSVDFSDWDEQGSNPTSGNVRGGRCSAPSLSSPGEGYVSSSQTINFIWSSVSGCTFNGYTFRIKDTFNMDSGGTVVDGIDHGVGGTSTTETISSQWNNRDLWWGVKAANAPNGADWSVRRFRIEPVVNCPQDGGVILYWNANYNCSNNLGDSGYRQRTSPGLQNVIDGEFNDDASSVKVPSGWSVRVFNDADGFGGNGSICFTSSISDFGPQGNFPGTGTAINDQVSSMEVFNNTSCSTAPNAPNPSSPANGQYFNEGESINLSWSTTGNEYYGEVWGGPAGTTTFGWQTSTSKNIGSQWAGYTYSWHVKARNGSPESGWSSTWTFTVRPGAPTNLNASAVSCNQINLSWSDNSGNEEGYKVYRNGSLIVTLPSGTTSYPDTGLAGNTGYSYTVNAYRGNIASNPSNTANATTSTCPAGIPALISPPNGYIFNEGEAIILWWSATGNEYYGEVWGGPAGITSFGWQTGTTKNIGSQWAGYTYSWHVKARNGSPESGWSNTGTFTVRPGAPGNLSASVISCSQINLSWSDNSGNEEGYKVYRNGSLIATLPSGTTSYPDTGLAGNTGYSYTVNAYRGNIASNSSNTANATTSACPVLTPDLIVQSVTASPASPTVNQPVTFTVRIKNQGTGNAGSGFYVDFYVDNQPGNCPSDGIHYWTIASLAAGATQDLTYNYTGFGTSGTHNVYAFADSFCQITESNDGNNTLGPISVNVQSLAAPTLISPTNNAIINRTTNVALSWNPVSGATQYYAEFTGGPGIYINSGWIPTTSWSLGPQWAGVYQWRVKARNNFGAESPWSEVRTLNIKPGTPGNLVASVISPTQINLSWNASSDAPNNIDGYRIYRGGIEIDTVPGGTTTYPTDVSCGTTYSYKVTAYKGSLESDASNIVNYTTPACRPDLVPAPRPGRADPIIASSVSGTPTNGPLYTGQQVYLDWGFTNAGNLDINSIYYVDIFIDNQRFVHYPYNALGVGEDGGFYDWSEIWNQSGLHTIKIVVDAENNIAESNETNNTWMNTFYWEGPIPSNDDFDSATIIASLPHNTSLDTTGATQAVDDPDLVACDRTAGLASVWYQYTPPATGTLTLDTRGSDYDTMLGVWTGNRGNLSLIDCNDDISATDYDSTLTLILSGGVPYYFEVSTYNGSLDTLEVLDSGKTSDVNVQSGGGQLQLHATYSVVPPPPPVLTSPANGSTITDYTPTLYWNNQPPTTDHYQIQVATTSTFAVANIVYDEITTDSEFTIPSDLLPGKIFYWRVRAFNGLEQPGAWSTVWYFKTGWLPPILISPPNGENPPTLRPTFDWEDVIGTPAGYTIQISRNNTFTLIAHTGNPVASTYTPTIDLPKGIPLFWRVQTRGTYGPSAWSDYGSFNSANSPSTPVLSLPASNALNTNYLPLFKWSIVTLPVGTVFQHYQLQVDNNIDFSSPELDDTSVSTLATPQLQSVTPFAPNTKLYWRVRAVNTDNEVSNWSTVWYFRTALTPPALFSPFDGEDMLTLRPTFDWDDVAGPGLTGYTIQVSRNNTFTLIVHTGNPVSSSYTPAIDLPKGIPLFWRVLTRGTNGPSAWSDYWSFNSANSPSTPVLNLPALNALNTNYLPLFKWSLVTLPVGTSFQYYELQVDDNVDFSSPELEDTSVATLTPAQFQTVTPFDPNTKFYWRVRAVNTDNEVSNWSTVSYFRTALTPPTLLSPFDGENVLTLRPTFDWDDVAGPGLTGYTIQVSRNNIFTLIVHTGNPVGSIYSPAVDLPKGVTLFWRVLTRGANGPSAPSEVRSFNSANSLSTPVLSLPALNALNTNYLPLFKWSLVTLPVGTSFQYYELQVDDNADFSSPELEDTSVATLTPPQFQTVTPFAPNTKFYWRVRAVNSDNEVSNWSTVSYFRTALTPPALFSPFDGEDMLTLRPTFDWDDVAGPGLTGYTIQVSRNNIFTLIVHTGNPVGSIYTPAIDLPKGVTLFWRVLTRGANGPSAPSEVRSFNSANSPSTPILSLPALNALNTNYLPLFKWSIVTLPVGTSFQYYELQVDDNPAFSSLELYDTSVGSLGTPQFQSVTPFDPNLKLYWRVRAVNTNNEVSNWSAVWYFRTLVEDPILLSPSYGATVISDRTPTFDWADLSGPGTATITGYTIQVSTSPSFSTLLVNATVVTSTYTPLTNLPLNTTLYWRVRTNGANGPSLYSPDHIFTISP